MLAADMRACKTGGEGCPFTLVTASAGLLAEW